jgi:hypothetical protein
MAKSLFPELDFTRENVLFWAEEQVALEPVLTRDPADVLVGTKTVSIANSVELVLRGALDRHYLQLFLGYDKEDLLEEMMTYVQQGIDKPTAAMNEGELLDEIMQICVKSEDGSNLFELETMDDFVRVFVKGGW